MPLNVEVETVRPTHVGGVIALFEQATTPCFCQYYSFSGDHREWQDRCANHRARSRETLEAEIDAGLVTAAVATLEGRVVGWARLSSPEHMAKLYEGRLYRNLPCLREDRGAVGTVMCFLVHPAHRREGVARRLLGGLVEMGRALGLESLEAFPRGVVDVSDEEQWTGPMALYEEAGFVRVHDFAPYPVYRLILPGSA